MLADRQTYRQTDTHTHPFNGPLSRTTRVSRYHKGKTSLDFTEARDSEWQWHQLGHMQVCTLLQTDNHASTPPLRQDTVITILIYRGQSNNEQLQYMERKRKCADTIGFLGWSFIMLKY